MLGDPAWATDPKLDTAAGRLNNTALIDRELAAFTVQHEPLELMARLQAAGVPAGMVQRSSDHQLDPQLAHRSFFRRLEHPEMGEVPYEGHQFRIRGYDNGPRLPAPCLGQHTYEVLKRDPRAWTTTRSRRSCPAAPAADPAIEWWGPARSCGPGPGPLPATPPAHCAPAEWRCAQPPVCRITELRASAAAGPFRWAHIASWMPAAFGRGSRVRPAGALGARRPSAPGHPLARGPPSGGHTSRQWMPAAFGYGSRGAPAGRLAVRLPPVRWPTVLLGIH